MSESKRFKAWLLRLDPAGPFSLDGIVEKFACDVLGKNSMDAESYAQANRSARWNNIIELNSDLEERGVTPLLVDVNMSTRTGKYSALNPSNGLTSWGRAIRSSGRSAVLRSIDSLGDRGYEALACVVSGCAGAEKVHLTPPGNEGGIDFFAIINSPGRCHVFSHSRSPIRVIGQCKKYSSPVSVDKVREFVHTISSVCQQSALVEKHVPPWFRGASGPVVGWIVGHSGFQAGAITLAKNYGILLSDSLDMAEICVQSRRFPAPYSKPDYDSFIKNEVSKALVAN